MAFQEAVEIVLKHEGGYVNDPKDPGGETNFGISKKAFPDVDIKNLTRSDAIKIYYDHYWKLSKVEILPESLWNIYFDMAVNMGKRRACKILQQACNHKNKEKIEVDGLLGINTANASKFVEAERVRSFRVRYYADLVSRKPTLDKFWFGWYRRALST
ncbi:MAG: putative glycosyl hydrolase [Prokaryotic dsDNA virus sp.]|nr:MAG: putative glycosyl hydrolase [Prokaryotic dsDNA virus sp.]|tara:strand:- start:189 stop:662 length:474 start_codon:yes stop_codon:yes gene_type:complete